MAVWAAACVPHEVDDPAAQPVTVITIAPDTSLVGSELPDAWSSLQQAVSSATGPTRIELAAGRYSLKPERYTEPACLNCADPEAVVESTVGLYVTGDGIEIVGPSEGTAEIVTNAHYGVLFDGCEGCAIRAVTVTAAASASATPATGGAVVVRSSSVEVERCTLIDDPRESVEIAGGARGAAGVVAREGARLRLTDTVIRRGSGDGVALYGGAVAEVRGNVIDGLMLEGDRARGGRMGLRMEGNAEALIEGNLIQRYPQGIGAFDNASVRMHHNVIERIAGWGIAYGSAGRGDPAASIVDNVVFQTGACGAVVWGPADPHSRSGALVGNLFVRTGLAPGQGSMGEPCDATPIAQRQVPVGFLIAGNVLHDNRQPGAADRPDELDRARFLDEAAPVIAELRAFVALEASAFMREFDRSR